MPLAMIGGMLIVLTSSIFIVRAVLIIQAKRSAELLFVPHSLPVLAGALLIGGMLIAATFLTVDSINIYCFVVPIMIGMLLLIMRIPYLAFYVIDAESIQRNIVGLRKTIAWSDIDWIYGEQSSTITRTRAGSYVGRGTAVETRYFIEAGPRLRITIPLGMGSDAQQANQLIQAISHRATKALFGRNNAHEVRVRRVAQTR